MPGRIAASCCLYEVIMSTLQGVLNKDVARTLKALRTSKGDYWNKQDPHELLPFSSRDFF